MARNDEGLRASIANDTLPSILAICNSPADYLEQAAAYLLLGCHHETTPSYSHKIAGLKLVFEATSIRQCCHYLSELQCSYLLYKRHMQHEGLEEIPISNLREPSGREKKAKFKPG